MGEASDIARRIHKRRVLSSAKANQAQAMGEALLYAAYGFQPSLDHYVPPSMTLQLRDTNHRVVTLACGNSSVLRISPVLCELADIIVFAQGTTFDDCVILGWLPSDWVREAPVIKTTEPADTHPFEVRSEFFLPLPREFDFVIPDVEVPRIWSYSCGGWWTPLGFYVYDAEARRRIEDFDRELAG